MRRGLAVTVTVADPVTHGVADRAGPVAVAVTVAVALAVAFAVAVTLALTVADG